MKRQAWILVAVVLLVAADAPKNSKDNFQGTWTVEQGTKSGQPLPPELLKGLRITFAGDKIILKSAGKKSAGTFVVDEAKKPREITITYTDGKTPPSNGIYILRDDKLYMCFGEPGMDRPTGFENKKGGKWELLVLAREVKGKQ